MKTLDSVPQSHLVIRYQEEKLVKTNKYLDVHPTLDYIVGSFRANKVTPLRGMFGGICRNGDIAGDIVLALYIQKTKALPESWCDECFAERALQFVEETCPYIGHMYFGYEGMYPTKQMSEEEEYAYNLGKKVWETLQVK